MYRLSDTQALLLTVDFFTPIVDDPYDFGRITAANSLSDIYAMGGVPLTAMNLLALSCALGSEVAAEILRGGAQVCHEAGVAVVGGHTIDDAEPKYGLSVMGMVHPDKIWFNQGARDGDVAVLTKSIGTGIWATALKWEVVTEKEACEAIESMATLNKAAMEAALDLEVHACTDITGFGLVGHLHEMAMASKVDAEISFERLPLLPRTKEFASRNITPGRTKDIVSWAREFVSFGDMYPPDRHALILDIIGDPQTSGGLLFAFSPSDADTYIQRMGTSAAAIGAFSTGDGVLHVI